MTTGITVSFERIIKGNVVLDGVRTKNISCNRDEWL